MTEIMWVCYLLPFIPQQPGEHPSAMLSSELTEGPRFAPEQPGFLRSVRSRLDRTETGTFHPQVKSANTLNTC